MKKSVGILLLILAAIGITLNSLVFIVVLGISVVLLFNLTLFSIIFAFLIGGSNIIIYYYYIKVNTISNFIIHKNYSKLKEIDFKRVKGAGLISIIFIFLIFGTNYSLSLKIFLVVFALIGLISLIVVNLISKKVKN